MNRRKTDRPRTVRPHPVRRLDGAAIGSTSLVVNRLGFFWFQGAGQDETVPQFDCQSDTATRSPVAILCLSVAD